MPPLNEGDLLYMPSTTYPGVSITKMREILQQTDRIIAKNFPRSNVSLARPGERRRRRTPHRFRNDRDHDHARDPKSTGAKGMTLEKLTRGDSNQCAPDSGSGEISGPCRSRHGSTCWPQVSRRRWASRSRDLISKSLLQRLGEQIEGIASAGLPGTLQRHLADRVVGGNYLDFDIDRREIARYGLSVADVQERHPVRHRWDECHLERRGPRERYPISLRYPKELRDNLANLRRRHRLAPNGAQVPLEQLTRTSNSARVPLRSRPRTHASMPGCSSTSEGIDVGSWVARAQEELAEKLARCRRDIRSPGAVNSST